MRRSEKVGHPLLGAEYLGHNKRNSKDMNHLKKQGKLKPDNKGISMGIRQIAKNAKIAKIAISTDHINQANMQRRQVEAKPTHRLQIEHKGNMKKRRKPQNEPSKIKFYKTGRNNH